MDEWRVIQDFPDYSVSTSGKIRRDRSGRVLAPKVNQYGVVYIGLMRDNRQHQRSVALLVASEFVPQPNRRFDTPINKSGDRYDNRVANLTWRPRWYAVKFNQQFKWPYEHPIRVPIRDAETGAEYENSWECALQNGLLERDVVLSILNYTYTAITYQRFEVVQE